MFGSIVKLQSVQNALGLRWFKGLVECRWCMRVQIVQHDHDTIGVWKQLIDKVWHAMSKVDLGALFCHFDVTPTGQGLEEEKEIARAIALILVIKALWATRFRGQRMTFLGNQLYLEFRLSIDPSAEAEVSQAL